LPMCYQDTALKNSKVEYLKMEYVIVYWLILNLLKKTTFSIGESI